MVEIHFKTFLSPAAASVMGGYNRTISTDRGSPIAGRAGMERQLGGLYHVRW